MRDAEKLIEYGRLLLVEGMITGEDVRESCSVEESVGDTVVDAVLMATPLTRDDLALFLSRRCLIPRLTTVDEVKHRPELAAMIPEEIAKRLKIVPLARWGEILVVGSEDIFNIEAVAELRQQHGMRIKMVQLPSGQYNEALDRAYGRAPAEQESALSEVLVLPPDPVPATPSEETASPEVQVVEMAPVEAAVDEVAVESDEEEDIVVEPKPVAPPIAPSVHIGAAAAQDETSEIKTVSLAMPGEKFDPLAISMDEFHAMEFALNWRIVNDWKKVYATEEPIEPSKIS